MLPSRRRWLLPGLGLCSLAGYGFAVVALEFTSARGDVLAFLALFAALFVLYGLAWRAARGGASIAWILGFAVAFRLVFVFAGVDLQRGANTFQVYDNDVWRYLWDGHQAANGLSPFVLSPDEIEEDDRLVEQLLGDDDAWWERFERIDHRGYRTIYPPLAQHAFRLSHALAPGSALAWKLSMAGVDIVNCLLLLLIARRLGADIPCVLLYAWNPLAIKEIAGSGHVDALVVLFLLLTVGAALRGGSASAGALFAAGLAVKPSTLPLAPLLAKRLGLRAALTAAAAAALTSLVLAWPWLRDLPALAVNLAAFARDWEFNAGPYRLLRLAVGPLAPGLAALALLGVVAGVLRRDDGSDRRLVAGVFVLLAATVLLSPTVMPWYLLWALPFAALTGRWSFAALTGLSLLTYLVYVDQTERAWWLWAEFGSYGLLLLIEWRHGYTAGWTRSSRFAA